jgi:hypothetical protein
MVFSSVLTVHPSPKDRLELPVERGHLGAQAQQAVQAQQARQALLAFQAQQVAALAHREMMAIPVPMAILALMAHSLLATKAP